MKIDAITNDLFSLFTLDGKTTRVRALPMADAVAWSALAAEARGRLEAAQDYGAVREAVMACREALAQYDGITAEALEACSTEQVLGAIDALLEVNDPFARRRRRAEAEQEKRQARELEIMKTLPADTVKMILEKNSDVLSAVSPSSSD